MPTGVPVLPQTISKIQADIKEGELNNTQIAHRSKVGVSVVSRLRRSMKSGTNGKKLSSGTGHITIKPDSKYSTFLPKIRQLRARGFSGPLIAKRLGIPKSAADYYVYTKLHREEKKANGNGSGTHAHLVPKIKQLRARGNSGPEIAKKLGIPLSTASYYIYGRSKKGGTHTNGDSTNKIIRNGKEEDTTITRAHWIALGIAKAEVIRVVSHVAGLSGIPAIWLGQELPAALRDGALW